MHLLVVTGVILPFRPLDEGELSYLIGNAFVLEFGNKFVLL